MSDPFTPEVSARICKHMNEDHADAVLLYAKVFGNTLEATSAEMLKIDAQGMDLMVKSQAEAMPVRISFDHELQDAEDAHHTLIDLVKQARQQANRS
ncbi:DUF2470 domain-containing protein [Leptolyngbya sp. NK1-12]|uniref:DUF2470 domain-containing protein n=1 Tax=Leptolyngbya sp. NK1-12 TaxID=2547451 RepID=A0AA96WI04_9CYAN|nr:DUF2470 domain-containing protein [Leptolyngbya sp. NK1-12]MBF2048268.1 DUF2470 domain-containing protein [Elainella sp. C42_A2020_010]WNZ25010.1 DUF2470 domain-containing protein [Leptolyngbya sp. NK1-12]